MLDAARSLASRLRAKPSVIRSGASIALTLALGGAAPVEAAAAAPRRGDGQLMVAMALEAAPRIAVALPARRAAVADPNRDGIVSRTEAVRYYQARFALLDRDRDGRVSRPELLEAASRYARGEALVVPFVHDAGATGSDAPSARRPLPGTDGPRPAWLAAGAGGQRAALFDLLDADRNGALSRREFTGAGAGDFAASDVDLDGQVTTREFYAAKRL